MSQLITDEQWWEFYQQGYLRLGRTLDDDALAEMQHEIDAIMLGTAKVDYERMLMQLDSETGRYEDLSAQTKGHKGATLDYRKIEQLEYDPVFLNYMRQPVFKEICARAYGAHASISCYRAMFMNKPARKGTMLPYHQDAGDQWGLDRDPLVTVWTALDPATKANGCVKVIPGTHKMGLLSDFGHTITPEQVEQYCPEEKTVYLEMEPGEAVLLHNWMLHGSDVNNTDIPRRAFSVCYMDARTRQGERYFSVIFGKNALELEPSSVR